jgi:hypothetical protein
MDIMLQQLATQTCTVELHEITAQQLAAMHAYISAHSTASPHTHFSQPPGPLFSPPPALDCVPSPLASKHMHLIDHRWTLVEANLSHPDFAAPIFPLKDASKTGIGGILYQLDSQQAPRYISIFSKSLSPAARNYSAMKRELLAILTALQKFNYYLYGRHFHIFTDTTH